MEISGGIVFSGGITLEIPIPTTWDLTYAGQVLARDTVSKVLYGWGYNTYGQLGDNSQVTRSNAVQISGSWNSVSANDNGTAGVKTDGTLYIWGYDASGMGGGTIGTGYFRSSPTQIGSSNTWTKVAFGTNFLLAIKSNGTLWAVGDNAGGQLGDNTIISRNSMVQIGSSSNWTSIYTGNNGYIAAAINSNNQLFIWGTEGQWGLFGLGTTSQSKSSPVQLPGSWSSVSIGGYVAAGIRTDGTLWSWGMNHLSTALGQLGDGTTIDRSSPVQVSGGGNWTMVRVLGESSIAIKTDGTLWSWGSGNNGVGPTGALGLNNSNSYSSPMQIGTSYWTNVGSGSYNGTSTAYSTRNDRTVWAWGLIPYGIGATTARSSPVQVSSLPTV